MQLKALWIELQQKVSSSGFEEKLTLVFLEVEKNRFVFLKEYHYNPIEFEKERITISLVKF